MRKQCIASVPGSHPVPLRARGNYCVTFELALPRGAFGRVKGRTWNYCAEGQPGIEANRICQFRYENIRSIRPIGYLTVAVCRIVVSLLPYLFVSAVSNSHILGNGRWERYPRVRNYKEKYGKDHHSSRRSRRTCSSSSVHSA